METKHARITPQHAAGGHVSRKHHELQQAFLALLWWQVVVVVVVVVVMCYAGSLSIVGWCLQGTVNEAGVEKAAGPG